MQEEIKKVSGIIFSVTVKKSGITNGRNWTIYEVIIGGESYSTFDAGYKESIGKQGTYEYVEKQNTSNGRVFTNKTLQALPIPGASQENQSKMISIPEVVVNTLISNQQKIMKALKIDSEIPTVEDVPEPTFEQ